MKQPLMDFLVTGSIVLRMGSTPQIFRFLAVEHQWLAARILLFKTFIYDKMRIILQQLME